MKPQKTLNTLKRDEFFKDANEVYAKLAECKNVLSAKTYNRLCKLIDKSMKMKWEVLKKTELYLNTIEIAMPPPNPQK
jgi:hypothetical protein